MEQPDQFQVELILADRTIPRGDRLVTQYKVKWKGYSANESTWEPIENLENCLHLLEAYQEKQKKKNESKPPKTSGNPKKATTKDKVNASREVLPKESAAHSSNDFYFEEDEEDNEAVNNTQHQQSKMEVEPAHEDVPQSASKEATKSKSKVKEVAGEDNEIKVPNKRGRKKKKTEEVQNGGSIDQINITYEQLGQRAAEEQLNYQPTKRIVKVNNQTEERWNSFTQTEPIVDIMTDMQITTIHSSHEYPGKVWFTVREFGKLKEISRSTLLESYPRVLYAYYHKHYLMAKQRSLDLLQDTRRNFEPKHINLLESNQESNSIQVSSESVSSEDSEDSQDYIYISEMQKERISRKRWKKEMKEKYSGSKQRIAVQEGSEEDQNNNEGE